MSATPTIERPGAAVAHPCYDPAHKSSAARLHLPVAPRCNVQCRFCDRSFDCVNESRPGVAATILTPREALERVDLVRSRLPNLTVVGIAGPGDPLANPDQVLETFALVKAAHPDLALCLATNGLGLPGRCAELAALGVTHLTVTVNALDPEVGRRVYSWVRVDGRARTGAEAAALLRDRQLQGIAEAAAAGITVKVNTILIPGVNEGEAAAIAAAAAERGAAFMNLIPLLPVAGTPLEYAGEPSKATVSAARAAAAVHLPQLAHCARCRADAAGALGADLPLSELGASSRTPVLPGAASPCSSGACPGASRPIAPRNCPAADGIPVPAGLSAAAVPLAEPAEAAPASAPPAEPLLVAVASREGLLVNRHLGEAERLFVFRVDPATGKHDTVDIRTTPESGGGASRWEDIALLISDCSHLLTSGIGGPPRGVLESKGIKVHVVEGLAGEALQALASGKSLSFLSRRSCGSNGCGGGSSNRGCGCA